MDQIAKRYKKAVRWYRTRSNPNLLILGENYEVSCTEENELGAGGFGKVYRGTNTCTNKPVAVKQLARTNKENDNLVERELRSLKTCNHKNIVKFFEHVKDDKSFYFIMEYCRHRDLDKFMLDKHVCYKDCLGYMRDITGAVQYLHEQEVCHCDIKPSNVLMADDDSGCIVKLADFGLSRELRYTDSTSKESVTPNRCTRYWMAPEISGLYNLAVDIFSLGLLFLALMTHIIGKWLTAFSGMYSQAFRFDQLNREHH